MLYAVICTDEKKSIDWWNLFFIVLFLTSNIVLFTVLRLVIFFFFLFMIFIMIFSYILKKPTNEIFQILRHDMTNKVSKTFRKSPMFRIFVSYFTIQPISSFFLNSKKKKKTNTCTRVSTFLIIMTTKKSKLNLELTKKKCN